MLSLFNFIDFSPRFVVLMEKGTRDFDQWTRSLQIMTTVLCLSIEPHGKNLLLTAFEFEYCNVSVNMNLMTFSQTNE